MNTATLLSTNKKSALGVAEMSTGLHTFVVTL